MKILIVDDNELVRGRLISSFSALPNIETIAHAGNISEALREFIASTPSLVILDIVLPDGSGFHLLGEIKKRAPQTLVFMLTNHAYPHYRKKSLEEGADRFFDKSAEFEALLETIGGMA